MKMKSILVALLIAITFMAFGQHPTMKLTFRAVNNTARVQLDSLKVMNLTKAEDTVLHNPDTVLMFEYPAGIAEFNPELKSLHVFQNYPNPVADHTTISLYVPEKGQVTIMVTDMLARMLLKTDRVLDKGAHSFRLTLDNEGLVFFTAQWKGNSSSIKMLHAGIDRNNTASLEYLGSSTETSQVKADKAVQKFSFSLGDELLYIGYSDTMQSGILDSPAESQIQTFQFATNIPCPGTPTVEYEGQVYNTIQVFSQCWLKENLNVGTMISFPQWMEDNGIMEKYCYNNETDSCVKYGGLYNWFEMMQYNYQQPAQGICPPGWHLPTDEEWKVLEGAVDYRYGIGNPIWNENFERGFDAGTNLKSTGGWQYGGNGADLYGFLGLPGGYRAIMAPGGPTCFGVGEKGNWWTATEYIESRLPSFSWSHGVGYENTGLTRKKEERNTGLSVRCIKDE
jgi:uncharacterized protein (TIGR02145 family)